jgi:hypothetical protein
MSARAQRAGYLIPGSDETGIRVKDPPQQTHIATSHGVPGRGPQGVATAATTSSRRRALIRRPTRGQLRASPHRERKPKPSKERRPPCEGPRGMTTTTTAPSFCLLAAGLEIKFRLREHTLSRQGRVDCARAEISGICRLATPSSW